MDQNIKQVRTRLESNFEQFRFRTGEMVLKKRKFYLEIKYWIYMRQASLGEAPDAQMKIYKNLGVLLTQASRFAP